MRLVVGVPFAKGNQVVQDITTSSSSGSDVMNVHSSKTISSFHVMPEADTSIALASRFNSVSGDPYGFWK